jgi:hypothetical protein
VVRLVGTLLHGGRRRRRRLLLLLGLRSRAVHSEGFHLTTECIILAHNGVAATLEQLDVFLLGTVLIDGCTAR